MTLHAERENHIPAANDLAGLDGNLETAARAADRADFSAILYVDLASANAFFPAFQDRFAPTRGELHVAAQGQHAGLGHDVLEVLILLNRIGMRGASFEQH